MSTRVMADCWPLEMPPTPKAVLISLADQANDQGYCWPSIATLCERTCFGERAVRNAIRWLESVQLVKVEIGAMKANRYTVTPRAYQPPEAQPTLLPPRHEVPPGTSCPPAPDAGHPARGAGEGGTTCPLTVIEPNTNTPPAPPGGGEAGPNGPSKPGRKPAPQVELKTWLAACDERGEMPIPADDPVFRYCDRVGIGRDILALHWHVFKQRRISSRKRQADWRQTFRNSVEANWYRLWFIRPGQAAELTSNGRQALSAKEAEERAAA